MHSKKLYFRPTPPPPCQTIHDRIYKRIWVAGASLKFHQFHFLLTPAYVEMYYMYKKDTMYICTKYDEERQVTKPTYPLQGCRSRTGCRYRMQKIIPLEI